MPLKDALRYDPTKTGLIRRAFEADIRKRLARIARIVYARIGREDWAGLMTVTTNVFCPTGPGGGIDPTCSPHSSSHPFIEDDFSGRNLVQRAADHYSGELTNSKIKTATGNPIPVYHGTQGDKELTRGEATYFSPDPRYGYVSGADHVHVAFLDIKNPYRTEDQSYVERVGYDSDEISRLKREGYDGVVYSKKDNILKGVTGWGNDYPQYITFESGQIKKIGKFDHDDLTWMLERGDLTTNRQWAPLSSDQKLEAFRRYLTTLFGEELTGPDHQSIWLRYVTKSMELGAGKAFKAVMSRKGKVTTSEERQFLRTSFLNPVAVDKVKLVASRVLSELKGVTDTMSASMTRVLADGIAQGKSPRVVGAEMSREIEDISRKRAVVIARTETIRAHAEGQLTALEQLGVTKLGVEVEWLTTGNGCPKCESMRGKVFTLEEAKGKIPLHPNCRCAWVPHVERVTNNSQGPTWNVFCPTGKGGGVDPTCKAHGAGSGVKSNPAADTTWKNIMGDVPTHRVHNMMGAPAGAEITLKSIGGQHLIIDIRTDTYYAERIIYKSKDGELVCKNQQMKVNDEHMGKGIGTTVFTKQVDTLSGMGFSKITSEATGNPSNPEWAHLNGYYTLPRMGFDVPLKELERGQRDHIKTTWPEAKSLLDVLKTPEGRSWWKTNGHEVWGDFDLKENSPSRQVLEAYNRERQNR